jgi:ribonuclease HI
LDYYWNLGIETNNRAEAYALFQGILLVKQKQIKTLNVVGDSKMIISLMISGSSSKDLSLKKIVDRIQLHSSGILMCFFHVYRHNNYEVDELANRAIGKSPGLLGVNLEESYAPLFKGPLFSPRSRLPHV